jgi:hypothetical protein
VTSALDGSLLEGVQVADVTAWLASHGWTRRGAFPRSDVLVFDGPLDADGEPLTAVVPSESSAEGFLDDIAKVVKLVAAVRGCTPDEASRELATSDADLVQVRVLSDFAQRGSLPLDFAADMVAALKDLVVAAACVEENPRAAYSRATRAAVEHAKSCRFGQTRRGSFIATLECPVTPVLGSPNESIDLPFERRVTSRIVRGIGQVSRAALDGRAEALVSGWRDGLNANMCESLLRLRGPDGETALEFSARWSRRVAAPADLGRPVRIDRTGFEFLSATSRALRAPTATESRAFTGHIVGLSDSRAGDDDGDDDGDDERIATLRFDENGRGKLQSARMHLGEADYKVACDAHRDGHTVTLKGRLDRRGNRWWIANVDGFTKVS